MILFVDVADRPKENRRCKRPCTGWQPIKAAMAVGMRTSLARCKRWRCQEKRDSAPAEAGQRPIPRSLASRSLAFLGAGNTHLHGDYAKNVQRGLEFLLASQAPDGNVAGEAETYAFMYSHGMATLAMSEAYAMTGDKRLQSAVQAAINYTLKAQIRATGGWRYEAVLRPGERGDTSLLGWQLMSLKSAELAGIDVPSSAGDGAIDI